MTAKRIILISILAAATAAPAAAANWPHWRGPDRNGVSRERGLPLGWDSTENVVWKLPLPGLSGSTPVIWERRIFLNVADGEKLWLWCVDRTDGSVLWRRYLDDGNVRQRKGNLSSPSPVTDGTGVWAVTGTGIVKAFDFEGNEVWAHDLQREYGPFGILHGYSSSPLLWRDRLVVQVLHGFHTDDPSYLLAWNKATGELLWRVERPTDAPREAPDAYTTPAVLERDARTEIVITGADYVTGHDPDSGAELWRLPGLNPTANPAQRVVASPVVEGRRIFVPSRVRPLLALEATGPGGAPRLLWSMDRGPDVPTPVVADGNLYLLTDKGIVWRLDATSGEVVWGPERVQSGTYSASPVLADGRIYVTNEAGVTSVISAGDRFEVLAENDLGEYTLSSLAISGGRIFLRTADHLYCIGTDEPAGSGSQPAPSPSAIPPPANTSP